MNARIYLILLLAVTTTITAVYGWRQRDERLRAEGRYELLRAHADSVAAVAEASQSALDAIIVQEDALIVMARRRAESAEAALRAGAARRPDLIERVVRDAGPDSVAVRAAVRQVVDSIQVFEISPRDVIITELHAIIDGKDRQLAAYGQVNYDLRVALTAARALVPPRPRRLERHGGTILKMAGAFAAGYAWGRAR